ncbi:hypothetical protein [Agromyces sp. H66]|uniref:hypothetical protein n=1 Tax=Agromyces sp. H66 TaxID=2529859 RepID=UPI0010AA5035|nr:hypothetical protein [Agromyces sp. H66]
MPEILERRPSAALSTLPGAAVLLRTRRLLIGALIAAFAYTALGVGSRSYCPGGFTGNGGFLDASGQPTDVAPQCLTLTLQPGGIVYAAITIIVLAAITRVLRSAASEAAAMRTLDRAAVAIIIVVVAWTLVTQVSFFTIPLDGWDGTEPFFFPFVFGNVHVEVTPLSNG